MKTTVPGTACRMEVQTAIEKKLPLARKRRLFRCDAMKLTCSNCPLYFPPKKQHKN